MPAEGLVICAMMVYPGIPMPWSVINATLLTLVGVGLVGAAAVFALGTRSALREAE